MRATTYHITGDYILFANGKLICNFLSFLLQQALKIMLNVSFVMHFFFFGGGGGVQLYKYSTSWIFLGNFPRMFFKHLPLRIFLNSCFMKTHGITTQQNSEDSMMMMLMITTAVSFIYKKHQILQSHFVNKRNFIKTESSLLYSVFNILSSLFVLFNRNSVFAD